jgi:hypothetical protein
VASAMFEKTSVLDRGFAVAFAMGVDPPVN